MAERYLIDTSGVIKYLNETFPSASLSFLDEIVDTESIISFITEIELQAWNPTNPDDLAVYQLFIANSTVVGITHEIIHETIRIRKSYKLKIPDAIIAATAIVNGLTLLADNNKDFLRVKGLKYVNPMSLSK